MQKIKFLRSPFIIAAIICFAIAIAIPLSVNNSEKKDIKGISQKISPTLTSVPSPTIEPTVSFKAQNSFSPSATPTVTVQTNSNNNQQASSPTPTSAPQQTIQTFQVSLKINNSSVGNVDVQEGGNQCDVLSRAKDQGKISQLLMKYDPNLGTNGVYQINGIGKENAVWWTYKVNGQSPTQGCSLVKANSGDNVEWEYKGN